MIWGNSPYYEGPALGPWNPEEERWWSCLGCRQTYCCKGWLADYHGTGDECNHGAYARAPYRKYLATVIEEEIEA